MKKIIVTGSTGSIGRAITEYLIKHHYDVIITSRSEQKLSELAQQLQNRTKEEIKFNPIDYLDTNTIISFQNWLKSTCKTINGIVIITPKPAVKQQLFPSEEDWINMFKSAFTGPIELIKHIIPLLAKNGKIVIISGLSSVQLMPEHSAYGVLRSMWLSQAKALSHKLGPKGILVNTVSPGGVLTPESIARIQKKAELNQCSYDEQYRKSISNVPLGKYAKPEEIASVVEFFLSDNSNHITGTNIVCDGGFSKNY